MAQREAFERNRRAATQFEIIGSEALLEELSSTLNKPKFATKLSPQERQLALQVIRKKLLIIEITVTVSDCRDPADNKLLELAASGGARFLITGDGDLLALHPWRDVAILTPRQFTEQA